jgi:hypothetical protein
VTIPVMRIATPASSEGSAFRALDSARDDPDPEHDDDGNDRQGGRPPGAFLGSWSPRLIGPGGASLLPQGTGIRPVADGAAKSR